MADEKRFKTFKQEIDGNDVVECALNLSDVKINTTNTTVEQLVLQIRNGKIYWTSTVGQSSTWRAEHECRLIESLLQRIPMSVFSRGCRREQLLVCSRQCNPVGN